MKYCRLQNETKTNKGLAVSRLTLYFCPFIFQAIKQMYVLVLGLDVLGNPFGLIRGLSEGVEAFFYEPYQVAMSHLKNVFWALEIYVCMSSLFLTISLVFQGAIQGPEEFVEGMALGVKALVGGAVGRSGL